MPIPFILGAIGIGAGLLGLGTGIKAAVDNNDAKDIDSRAQSIIDDAKENLEKSRIRTRQALESLGNEKKWVLDHSIDQFVKAFKKLHNVDRVNLVGRDDIKIDVHVVYDLEKMSDYISSILGGTAGGALGGALTAFAAYGGAMTFGAASTGTAIASLSGAAATNATLAFLGGGSLAVGGLGMAGGAMVLGGLVAGPALAVMGLIIGAQASENLDKARSNLAEAKKIAEELKVKSVVCNGISERSHLLNQLLTALNSLFYPQISKMEEIIQTRGVEYPTFTPDEQYTVAAACALATAINTVLNTSILTEDGRLTDASLQVADNTVKFIQNFSKQ
jgi:hypothetical protein